MSAPLPLFHPARMAATFFWVGHARFAPGTWGSLAALPFAWGLLTVGGWPALLAASLLATAIGFWASGQYALALGWKDPGEVVIDEVAGQWLALLPAALEPMSFVVGFVAFRIFDILKPFPASWADSKLDGAAGIMIDDLFAGIYAALTLAAYHHFF